VEQLLTHFAGRAGVAIELLALAWLAIGILASLLFAAADTIRRHVDAYQALRRRLARVTLLGLELLIAADIIETIVTRPTFSNLGALGLIVLIRTLLSFALEVEIDGRWPWARGRNQSGPSGERDRS
jgi:uncharacterized membrane protein